MCLSKKKAVLNDKNGGFHDEECRLQVITAYYDYKLDHDSDSLIPSADLSTSLYSWYLVMSQLNTIISSLVRIVTLLPPYTENQHTSRL